MVLETSPFALTGETLKQSGIPLFSVSLATCTIEDVNPALGLRLGVPNPQQFIGKPIADFLVDKSDENIGRIRQWSLSTARTLHTMQRTNRISSSAQKIFDQSPEVQIRISPSESSTFVEKTVKFSPSFIRDNKGHIIGLFASVNDITDEIKKRDYAIALANAQGSLHKHLDLPKVLDTISMELKHFVPYDSASLMFITDNELTDAYYWRSHDTNIVQADNIEGLKTRIKGTQNIQRMLSAKEVVYIPDTTKEDSGYQTTEYSQGIISYLGIPLIIDDKVVGILNLNSKSINFTEEHVRSARDFSDVIRQALENARIHEYIKDLSEKDRLTGLYNQGYFHHKLADELKRAKRYKSELSLLYIDADTLKLINDRLGHKVGDDYIIEHADTFRRIARREIDTIARIGGDEFAIILPDTNYLHAVRLAIEIRNEAERISREKRKEFSVTDNTIPIGESTNLPLGTLSIGVTSTSISKSYDIDKLITDADQALYKAKKEKNCVNLFGTDFVMREQD